jgi:hypothetical protein
MRASALAILAATVALTGAAPAAGYWSAGGTGAASAGVETLAAGNTPTASAAGHTVTISWAQSTIGSQPLGGFALGGYAVLRYPAGGGSAVTPGPGCAAAVSGSGASLTCAEANVPPGAWQYTVTTLLGTWTGAESTKSATVSVSPDEPVLTAAAAQNPGAGQSTGAVALSWSAVPGATGYNIYRRAGSGSYDFSAPLNGATPVTSNAYTDPGSALTGGTSYTYVVRAVTAGTESTNSNELSAVAIARAVAPASVTVTLAPAGAITVTWPSVSGASGYNVYRRLAAGSYDYSAPLNGGTPLSTAAFDDVTATNGTTYRYVVRSVVIGAAATALESLADSAESAAATSDATPPASATINDPGSPLRATLTLSGSAADAGSGVSSLQMQYTPAGTSAWTSGCTAVVAPFSCSFDTTTTADGAYDIRSLATDLAGNTTASAIVADRRIDNTGPTVTMGDPGGFIRGTVTLGAAPADSGSGIASVTIQRAPAATATWTTVCSDTTVPYSCSLNTIVLTDGGYDLRAVATDIAGNTTTSATVANRVVDNTAPTGVDIQTSNVAGGTVGKPETGDLLTFTLSEPVAPASVLSGWGGAATSVVVRFTNGNPDVISVYDSTNTTQLALGSVRSGKKYVTGDVAFLASSALLSGSTIAVTLGVPNGSTAKANGSTTLQWTPSTAATDRAGNPLTAGTIAESGLADLDF